METGDPEFKASLSYRVRLYLKMGERAIMKQPWEVVLCSKKAQLFSKGSRGHKKKKKIAGSRGRWVHRRIFLPIWRCMVAQSPSGATVPLFNNKDQHDNL